MRIPAREVLFIGQHQCQEFDYSQEPLPGELKVLLCLLDGAERRRHLQAKFKCSAPQFEAGNGRAECFVSGEALDAVTG
jgi:hypothetical protein